MGSVLALEDVGATGEVALKWIVSFGEGPLALVESEVFTVQEPLPLGY